jgi:hypothetical protein
VSRLRIERIILRRPDASKERQPLSEHSKIWLVPPLTTYPIRANARRRALEWVLEGLKAAGARILAEPDLSQAPFIILVELPWTGERVGIVAYLFTATSRDTRKRPKDEARFQIKYGSKRDEEIFARPPSS